MLLTLFFFIVLAENLVHFIWTNPFFDKVKTNSLKNYV